MPTPSPERSALLPARLLALLRRSDFQMALLLVVVFLLSLPTLRFSLVYDDIDQLVRNPRIAAWHYVPSYFTSHLWSQMPNEAPHYYRPFFLLWFRLIFAFLGAPSPIWHMAGVMAHLAAVCAVFLLVRQLLSNTGAAVIAATLFVLHPVNSEVVAWISASGDSLLTVFVACSVLLYARRKGPISPTSLLCALAAMFVKEGGIVVPALIFA
jgi:hypothetical protein